MADYRTRAAVKLIGLKSLQAVLIQLSRPESVSFLDVRWYIQRQGLLPKNVYCVSDHYETPAARARVGIAHGGKDVGVGVGLLWQRTDDAQMFGIYFAETAGR